MQKPKNVHPVRSRSSLGGRSRAVGRAASNRVETYIAGAPKEVRGKLKQLRKAILAAAPEAEEKISYGMPYYSYKGRLAYFAYFKNHVSFFAMPPMPEEYRRELKKRMTGKATIRFDFKEKLPVAFLKNIVKARVKRNSEKI